MTAPKQACSRYRWCTGKHENGYTLPLHKSEEIAVGPARFKGFGQVVLWLQSGADGPVKLAVQAAHMANTVVPLLLDDADVCVDMMVKLIGQARRG